MAKNEIDGDRVASIGRTLRQWRVIRRYKQNYVAELLKVSQATVSRWENGYIVPDSDERKAIEQLLATRLDNQGDRQLARLIESSTLSLHLVCDLTHRFLVCSAPRSRELHVETNELIGESLWQCASKEIYEAEAQLESIGWYEKPGAVFDGKTSERQGPIIDITPSDFAAQLEPARKIA